jgi:hypothetical protein
MSEETQEQSTGGSLKNVIIGFISTITLGVGGWVTTKLTGGEEKEAPVQTAAPVINITNSQTQSAGGGGTTKIIEREKVVEKPVAAPKPKKEADEFKEKPAAW